MKFLTVSKFSATCTTAKFGIKYAVQSRGEEQRTMTTPYEKPYPTYIVNPPADVKDGSYTVPELEAKLRADQDAVNKAAAATGTSVFDDGKDNTVPSKAI